VWSPSASDEEYRLHLFIPFTLDEIPWATLQQHCQVRALVPYLHPPLCLLTALQQLLGIADDQDREVLGLLILKLIRRLSFLSCVILQVGQPFPARLAVAHGNAAQHMG